MKSLIALWRYLAIESARWCNISADRDIETVTIRTEHEGLSFLTITLPSFGKDFERSLDQGYIGDDQFAGFKRVGGLPAFLQGFLRLVFCPGTGTLVDAPILAAVRSVRQLTLMYGKIELPCSESRTAKAIKAYIDCEKELTDYERRAGLYAPNSQLLAEWSYCPEWNNTPSGPQRTIPEVLVPMAGLGPSTRSLSRRSRIGGEGSSFLPEGRIPSLPNVHYGLHGSHGIPVAAEPPISGRSQASGRSYVTPLNRGLRNIHATSIRLYGRSTGLRALDRHFYSGDWSGLNEALRPSHGPGATADRLVGNAKYLQSEWPARLNEFFPIEDWLIPSHSHFEWLDQVNILEPCAERPVRVITVHKTLKTPRIIAIEPTAMQYSQQALRGFLYKTLESDPLIGPLIGFRDQEPNRALARKGSMNGTLATLDLSEASDRVLNSHVLEMLAPWPHLSGAVQACRSTHADVPGHGVIPLTKFASMGSALTFPIEAMLFLLSVVSSISRELRVPVTEEFIRGLHGKVRVYGDDIIVPVEFVASVIDGLEDLGLKVNHDKSFWTGKFRESCGGDYYDGVWVTPTRCRRVFPTSRRDVPETLSLVSLRNQLFMAGYRDTCDWLDKRIMEVLPHFPFIEPTSPLLGRYGPTAVAEGSCPNLHRPLAKGYVVKAKSPESKLDGVPALQKWFIERGAQPLSVDHLERSGRPQAVYLKLAWAPVR